MKKSITILAALLLVAGTTQGAQLLHLDFAVKNTPFAVDDYTDVSGNGRHGDESGTWWNFDGDSNANADLWDDVGGARGGVYTHRSTHEQVYETTQRVGNATNNRVILSNTPTIAANAGITLALWVNPEVDHVEYGQIDGGDADFAHLIALGGYGVTPITTIELDSAKRVHGFIEGTGGSQVEVTGSASIPANAWTHIAITYDRANDVATTYINGQFDSSQSIASVSDGVITYGNSSRIGGGFENFGHSDSYLGMLDDAMIFDEVLTEDQIAAIMIPEPATVALLALGGLMWLVRRKG